MGKVKGTTSSKKSSRKGEKPASCQEPAQCPHQHFHYDPPDRRGIARDKLTNILATPKGYRWEDVKKESGDGERPTKKTLMPSKRLCPDKLEKKPNKGYVHNFLAEVWSFLTPEMANRLKTMLMTEFSMSDREAEDFVFKQREANITNSSTVSLYKKPRDIGDGKVVLDSVVKLRTPNKTYCDKFPKSTIGVRNSWIKDISDLVSDKMVDYVLDTMSAQRTERQQEIAKNLLNRFNTVLEQKASMTNPKTQTHVTMVLVADRLSLWLDKNVPMSKENDQRLKSLEEAEARKKFEEDRRRKLKEEQKRAKAAREEEEEEEEEDEDEGEPGGKPEGPGAEVKEPELGKPRAKPEEPRAEPGEPGALPGEPEEKQMEPGAQPGEPSAPPGEPGAEPGEPRTEPGEPGAQPEEPEPQPGEPGAQPEEPGPQPGEPGGEAGAQTQEPGAQPQEPGAQPEEPGAQPGEPGAQPGEPGAQPGEPGAQPGEPGAQPGEPGAQPGEPEAQPETPGAQPEAPEGQPEPPAAAPGEPETQPEAPAAQPEAPEGQPEPTAVPPGEPETQPEAPVAQPETPEGQPEPPAAAPVEPETQPEAPEAQPEAPAAQPETPEAQPETPEAQPEAPAAQPEAPEGPPGEPETQPETPEAAPQEPEAQPETVVEPEVQAAAPAAEAQPERPAGPPGEPEGQPKEPQPVDTDAPVTEEEGEKPGEEGPPGTVDQEKTPDETSPAKPEPTGDELELTPSQIQEKAAAEAVPEEKKEVGPEAERLPGDADQLEGKEPPAEVPEEKPEGVKDTGEPPRPKASEGDLGDREKAPAKHGEPLMTESERKRQKSVIETVASKILETAVDETPRQEAIAEVVKKDLEKEVGPEHKDLVDQVASKVGTWIDKMVEQVETEYGERERRSPSGVLPDGQRRKGRIFRVKKVDECRGPCFDVDMVSTTNVGQKIRMARGKPQASPKIPNPDAALEPADLKSWAEWAATVTEMAQSWAEWIEDTVQETRKRGDILQKDDSPERLREWEAFKRKKSQGALHWQKTKQEVDETANIWSQKGIKTRELNQE